MSIFWILVAISVGCTGVLAMMLMQAEPDPFEKAEDEANEESDEENQAE